MVNTSSSSENKDKSDKQKKEGNQPYTNNAQTVKIRPQPFCPETTLPR
jgi:hypothetical protein